MAHDTHTKDPLNQDLVGFTRQDYLDMVDGFDSSFMLPQITPYKLDDGRLINVIDEAKIAVGSKCRFGEYLVANTRHDTIVYVQPRFGFAGISLTWLCKKYNKRLVLFMPSSKKVSEHQAYCIYHGCEPHFRRIAAMPVLNKYAKEWAEENGAFFVPLGLRHPEVTAMIVDTCEKLHQSGHDPGAIWCAISTGVLSRGLQIGFPDASVHNVAVARNIKKGERGDASIYSYPRPFTQSVASRVMAPFDSCDNYDLKAWHIVKDYAHGGDYFWNVAGNLNFTEEVKIESYRDWGEIR